MNRAAFVMSVNQGCQQEYEQRHNPVWPDMLEMLKKHGLHNYSIFLHPQTRQLFAVVEYEDQAMMDSIADEPIAKKWYTYMKDMMAVNPDDSPAMIHMKEVFHMD